MNTCKHCRWWQKEHGGHTHIGDDMIDPWDSDTYEEMTNIHKVRYCNSPKLVFNERPVEPDWATLIDGSDYAAVLITGADFGCVNFEETVAQPPE